MERGTETDPGREIDTDGLFLEGQSPFSFDGALFFPIVDLRIGICTFEGTDSLLVQLAAAAESMLNNKVGFFIRMTPDGARQMAEDLIIAAQKVEAHVAEQAAAAIEKARKS